MGQLLAPLKMLIRCGVNSFYKAEGKSKEDIIFIAFKIEITGFDYSFQRKQKKNETHFQISVVCSNSFFEINYCLYDFILSCHSQVDILCIATSVSLPPLQRQLLPCYLSSSLPYFIEYEELVMPTFFINVFLPPSSSGNRKDNPLGESHYRL